MNPVVVVNMSSAANICLNFGDWARKKKLFFCKSCAHAHVIVEVNLHSSKDVGFCL